MPLSQRLFRGSALEQLSTPEQLDRLLRITSPKGWIALIAIWALLSAIIAWAFLGRLPTKEAGPGILIAGGGLKLIEASGEGRLAQLTVTVGDPVKEGQIVAIIERRTLRDELELAEENLTAIKADNEKHVEEDEEDRLAAKELAAGEKERWTRAKENAEARLVKLEDFREQVARGMKEGAFSAKELFERETELGRVQYDRDHAALQLQEVDRTLLAGDLERRQKRQRTMGLEQQQRRVKVLRDRLKRESEVIAPLAGRIVEIRAAPGMALEIGDPLLVVEPEGARRGGLEAILYVSATTGKNIKEGMQVDLSPSTVKREEYGTLKGIVRFRADVSTSRPAMFAALADNDLVESFISEIGLPLEVRVELTLDDGTPSGYEWSSKMGPPTRVSAGTLCEGWVTLEERSPISLVLPHLKGSIDG